VQGSGSGVEFTMYVRRYSMD